MERACENCAAADEDLELVYRIYVVPETWDNPGSQTRMDDAELWCFPCRSMYPHEMAESGDED